MSTPEASHTSQPPADVRATVSQLAAELGDDAAVELIQAFLADTPDRLAEVRSLAGGPDQVTLRRVAHSLKGSAALFGAFELETAARRLEETARLSETEAQAAVSDALLRAYETVRPLLEQLLAELGPDVP